MTRRLAIPLVLLLSAVPARAQEPEGPAFNPYRAEKSVEIGTFYMKKGNYDAAIERFEEATRYKPNFARAYRLLGEAYEKKGEKREAIQAYQKFLEILPGSPDAGKVRKRIQKLSREMERLRRRSG